MADYAAQAEKFLKDMLYPGFDEAMVDGYLAKYNEEDDRLWVEEQRRIFDGKVIYPFIPKIAALLKQKYEGTPAVVTAPTPMVNVATIIEIEASRLFAAYSGKRIRQKSLLEEISNAAMGATLAEGGNDKMFNKAWKASLANLKLRYENEIKNKAPQGRKAPLDIELLSQQEVEFVDEQRTEVKASYDVLYLMIAEQGVILAYTAFLDTKTQYNPLLRLGQAIFKPLEQRFVPGLADLVGGNRCFTIIQPGTREEFDLVPLSQITADFDAFVTAVKAAMAGRFAVQVLGSRELPLTQFPKLVKPPKKEFVERHKPTVEGPLGRDIPLSPVEADERILGIETKYAAKLPRGLSKYQRDVAKWLLTGTGNAFVEAVAGSGKSTTLLYCAELMADYGGNKVMVSFNSNIAKMNLAALEARGVLMSSITLNTLGNQTLPVGRPFVPGDQTMATKYKKIVENEVVWPYLQSKYNTTMSRQMSSDLTKKFEADEDAEEGSDELDLNAFGDSDPRVTLAKKLKSEAWAWSRALESAVGLVGSTLVDPDNIAAFYQTLIYYGIDLKGVVPNEENKEGSEGSEDSEDDLDEDSGEEFVDGTIVVNKLPKFKAIDSEGKEITIPPGVVELAKLTKRCLEIGRRQLSQGIRGFFDQTYWPAMGDPICRYPQYSLMFVDEAQDLSNCNIEVLKRSLAPGGRIIFVGDRSQAIYGFRGADTNAVTNVITNFNCDLLPLSTCYRCARVVIEQAQKYVPQIEATPWAKEGEVLDIDETKYSEMIAAGDGPKIGDLILCRFNAPLAIFGMRVLKAGLKVKILGREDFIRETRAVIGKIVAIMRKNKWPPSEFGTGAVSYHADLQEAANKIKDDGKKAKMQFKMDCVDFVREVWDSNATGPENERFRNDKQLREFLFKPDGLIVIDPSKTTDDFKREAVVCCTIHKSKGDEAQNVWWIGPQMHMGIKQSWQIQEEHNLRYVAITRAQTRLVRIKFGKPEDKRLSGEKTDDKGDSDGE